MSVKQTLLRANKYFRITETMCSKLTCT